MFLCPPSSPCDVTPHPYSLQNLSKLQRAQNLKVALDSMQPPPENVRLHHIVPFIWLHYLSFCFCLQSSLHIRTDDPCSQVKQVEKNARARIVFTHPLCEKTKLLQFTLFSLGPTQKTHLNSSAALQGCLSIFEGAASAVPKSKGERPIKPREDGSSLSRRNSSIEDRQ